MGLTIMDKLDQGSDEWHDARRGMVTASVVGRLITARTIKPASNDDSRALTALLVAERITGYTDFTWTNADMQRGIDNEPRARDKYAEKYAPVTEVGFMVRRLPGGVRIGYSPDGLVGDDGLIEVKSPRAKTHIKTVLEGEVPIHYMPQLQAGLLVSGRKWIDFISYSGGLHMWVKRVTPDERWFEAIVQAVTAFEKTAAEMTAAYEQATRGLVETERIDLNSLGLVF